MQINEVKPRKKPGKAPLFKFIAVCLAAVLLSIGAISLMSAPNTLAEASRNCDTISISAEYNSALKSLVVTQNIIYKNRTDTALDEIKFHIYANAYRDGARFTPVTESEVPKAYPNGKSFGNISVGSVSVNAGTVQTVVEGEDANVLSVPLVSSLGRNKSVSIDLTYTVKLANIKHRLGYTDAAVNLGNFYPVPCVFENGEWQTYPYSYNGDPFYNELHNFNVTLTCDKNFIVASSGSLTESSPVGNARTVYSFKSSAIRDFAMVLSENFKTLSQTVKGTAIKYYYIDDDSPAESLACAVDAVNTFSRLFVKYPYAQLSVVQTDFLHGGMEYGELVYISRDVLTGNGTAEQNRAVNNQVIIHEIAHQWWYGMTGNNQVDTAWIDEGLAEYSTLLFYGQNPAYNVDKKTLTQSARDNYAMYVKILDSLGADSSVNMNQDLNSFRSSYDYVFMTYVRGMLLFADLANMLGEANLIQALGQFSRETSFSFATQDKLVASLERSTRTKLKSFFNIYLGGIN